MKTIETVYKSCALSYGRAPAADQCEAWKKILGRHSIAAIERAVDAWQGCIDLDIYGEPKGRKFPTPADLCDIVAKNERITAGQLGQFVNCKTCEGGWIKVMDGRTAGGNPVDPKVGAVQRCQCWWQYLMGYYGVSTRAGLDQKLEEKRRDRQQKRGRA